jgi:signal transduction histidine kinase
VVRATLKAVKGTTTEAPKGVGEMAALAAAAHELKSPLALVQLLAQTLSDQDMHLSDEQRAQYLQRLRFTSERMLRLVQQLAVSYRLDSDRQLAFQFQLEPLSIGEICENVAHEMLPYAREHNQELRVGHSSCPHLVIANREILHDIVVNLIDNSIRHNPRGGHIDIFGKCRSNQVRLTVQDQGVGVLPSEVGELRQTLGKQPQPFSGRSATSGLGLYIVGQFAEAMGGSLGLGRNEGGARFFVDLLRSTQTSLL